MLPVELSHEARLDLDDIWLHLAIRSESTADAVHRRLVERMNGLGEFPNAGTPRSDLRDGLRSRPCQRWLIFYVTLDDKVVVDRIVDGARDISGMFGR